MKMATKYFRLPPKYIKQMKDIKYSKYVSIHTEKV